MKQWHGSGCRFIVDGEPIGRVAWGPDNTDSLQLHIVDTCHQLPPPVTVKPEQSDAGFLIKFPDIGLSFQTDAQGGNAVVMTVDRFNAFAESGHTPETPEDTQKSVNNQPSDSSLVKSPSRVKKTNIDEDQLGFEGL